MTLSQGAKAPEFTLPGAPADRDQSIEQYALSDALATGPVIVSFYLFDFHPECTEQLCDLNNLSWFGIDEDVTTFAISTDRAFSHHRFSDSENFDFPLLSDSDGSVADAFGVLHSEFEHHRLIAKRSAFVIDSDGVVRYAWSTDEPTRHPDWGEVSDAVNALTTALPEET